MTLDRMLIVFLIFLAPQERGYRWCTPDSCCSPLKIKLKQNESQDVCPTHRTLRPCSNWKSKPVAHYCTTGFTSWLLAGLLAGETGLPCGHNPYPSRRLLGLLLGQGTCPVEADQGLFKMCIFCNNSDVYEFLKLSIVDTIWQGRC